MDEQSSPKIAKWPFIAGDILLLATAWFISNWGRSSLGPIEFGLLVLCVAVGAVLAVVPYVLEYRALARAAEANALTSVVAQIKNVQALADRVGEATGRWQFVQEAADKTASSAKGIAEKMANEVQAFSEFMQRVNDTEKTNLRLEVEKLRRGEADWLQAMVRTLDHVYALYLGAVRSGQPTLIDQLTNFQNACRDAARRVGLTPFVPARDEKFNAERHQLIEGNPKDAADTLVADVVATGFTFQGRPLRPALVRVKPASPAAEAEEIVLVTEVEPQGQLTLEAGGKTSPG